MNAGRSPRRRVSSYSLAGEATLWALAFFCPLALGSAPGWTLWPLVLFSFAAAGLSAIGAARMNQGLSLPFFAALPALGALLCALQLLPLPPPLLRLLSTPAAELREFALVPLGLTSWRPVSMDAPSTWRELAKYLSYFSVLVAAAQVARSRRARRRLFCAVALAGALVALIGFGHQLVGASTLFGVYRYAGAPALLSTFGNPNHLAGYLTLAGTAALGLALSAADRQRALLWGLAYLACGAGCLLSLSRGGIVFFFVAQLLFAGLLLAQRARSRPGEAASPPLLGRGALALAAAFVVLATGSYLAYERIAAELATADSVEKIRRSKVDLWPMLAEGAQAFWVAGMGRGTFEVAFTPHQQMAIHGTFTHPENIVLQHWAEVGVLGAGALFFLAGWALSRAARRDDLTPLELAALCAATAVGLHNLFDFNLELAACAVSAAVLLGASTGTARTERASKGLLLLPLLGVALLASFFAGPTFRDAGDALAKKVKEGATAEQARAFALPLIDRHPADYFLYEVVGQVYGAQKGADPKEALAFANRALYLRPIDAEAHRVAARALLRLGKKKQALLEYQLAHAAGAPEALREGLFVARGVEELLRLAPSEPARRHELVTLLRTHGRVEESNALLDLSLEELGKQPEAMELWLLSASYRLSLEEVEVAERLQPGALRVQLTRASILSSTGKKDEAVGILHALVKSHPDSLELAFSLASYQLEAGKPRAAREALSRVSPFVSDPNQRASLMLLEANAYEREGKPAKAIQSIQTAARLQPETPSHHYHAARLYEAMGRLPEAAEAVRAGLRHEKPPAEANRVWLSRLEEQLTATQAERERTLLETDEGD